MATVNRTATIATRDELEEVSVILSEAASVAGILGEQISTRDSQASRAIFGIMRLMWQADDQIRKLSSSIYSASPEREAP